jgi:pSer/pThr/pTyr-binding forkhead associated (FHA) protein
MAELWINWRDETGAGGRVRADRSPFVVGRGATCDLVIASNKLSREHLSIERYGDGFIISDRGSSNGTELNSLPLIVPTEIMDGDRASLGGGAALKFEIGWDDRAIEEYDSETETVQVAAVTVDAPPSAPVAVAEENGGIPSWLLIAAPVALFLFVVIAIGLVLLLGGGGSTQVSNIGIRNTRTPDEGPSEDKTPTSKTPSASPSGSPGSSNEIIPLPSPTNLGENAKVEQNAAAFLRRIAQNDPKAFLTAEQAQKVSSKAKQFSNSQTLAANIESARKNAAAIKTLAASKNLTPQFLATAAMTKLGNSRGDVLQTAQSMADILERLQTQIGCELYDDCLMMVAAYDQGERGDFMRLRNTLQDLANKFPESSRAIRSIWFLQKQGKITDAEFDFALKFLAIGTITQNPRDFGVSAEQLTL